MPSSTTGWEVVATFELLAIGAFLVAFVISFLVTPPTSGLARRLGILDLPHEEGTGYKAHAAPVPYLGGAAIFCGIAGGGLFVFLISEADPTTTLRLLLVPAAIAAALGVIGLLDDIRSVHPALKLGAQVSAALGAWALGFNVSLTSVEVLDLGLTVLWIVGITNAFNLLDNMDGLSAGVAGIAGLTFAAMAALGGMPGLAVVAASLSGAAFGFLAHNRHPAKIYMGDAGSLLLGFALALLGVRLRFDNLVEVTFLVPVVVLGIPIFDTTLVVLGRLRHRRPVFAGGRDHVSHRLVKVGLPVQATVGLLYWSALCLGWLGLVISRSSVQVGWMLLGFVIAVGAFFGALLWGVPVYGEPGSQPDDVSSTLPESVAAIEHHR